jgi:hypothetical protein
MDDPRLTLNFTTGSLDPRVTITRGLNTATRVNGNGLIEAVNANLPRLDYDPTTLAQNGLLIEESRQNISLQSADYSLWTITGALTFSGNTTVAPDGTQTADTVSGSAAFQSIQRTNTILNATTYTWSLFVTNADRGIVTLRMSSGTNDVRKKINLSTGAVSDGGGNGVGFVAAGSQQFGLYYRVYLTVASGGTTLTRNFYPDDIAIARTHTATVWGDQLEAGAFATSYIPTTTAAVTRNADVATITGTNFSGFWQAGKGSALVRARPSTVSGIRPLIQFDDTTADNIIALRGNTTNPELYVRAGGSDQAQIDAGTIAANVRYRLAGAWATDNCAASVNSGTPALDGVATIPVVTQARLGSDGTNYLNGHLEAIEYYDERVLNASLQVVSSTAGYRSIINPVFRDTIIS